MSLAVPYLSLSPKIVWHKCSGNAACKVGSHSCIIESFQFGDTNGNVDLHAPLLERDLDCRVFASVPLFDLVFLGTCMFRLLEGRDCSCTRFRQIVLRLSLWLVLKPLVSPGIQVSSSILRV